jgi:uncharacterized protein
MWFLVICLYFLWIVRIVWAVPLDNQIASLDWKRVVAEVWRIIVWVLPVLWLMRRKLDLRQGLAAVPKNFFSWFEVFGLVVLYMGLSFGILRFGFKQHLLLVDPVYSWSGWLSLIVAPMVEEFFFRGYLLFELNKRYGFGRANLIQSFCFGLLHFPGWWYFQGVRLDQLYQFIGVVVFGWVLGISVKRSGSWMPGAVGHLFNNYFFTYVLRFVS